MALSSRAWCVRTNLQKTLLTPFNNTYGCNIIRTISSTHILNSRTRIVPASRLTVVAADYINKSNNFNGVLSLGSNFQNYCTAAAEEKNPNVSNENQNTTKGNENIPDNSTNTTTTSSEQGKGDAVVHEFQAETKMLLDIVAKSLYSDKEVFIRELVSNASDACEKFRYESLTGTTLDDPGRELEIKINTDKENRTLTFQDNGIGMNKEEMIENLGTIAKSGSKAFMEKFRKEGSQDPNDIIGQFGVGFYSSFMVAEKIEVFSKSSKGDEPGHLWITDNSGKYTIEEADGVQSGTKIIIHLKPECADFSENDIVKDILKKYSNFVSSKISLNNAKVNRLSPVWLMDPKEVDEELHEDFYRYISNAYDKPRFKLHYKIDAPMDIKALFYFPESRPGMFEMSRDSESGVALYCRKVMIKSKAENILPKYLRFVKGVVDSEDIPLNLSRELLQDSALIRKLRTVLTNRIIRFLDERSRKQKKEFDEFYKEYSLFFKEGILSSHEQLEKEEIAKLLRFESSINAPGETISIAEYCGRMRAGQRDIFYISAPSRQLAESSPYFESMKKKDIEVLFCYESYDELVLMQLQQFDQKKLTSVEKEMRDQPEDLSNTKEDSLSTEDSKDLSSWLKTILDKKVSNVKVTSKLENHPCVVTVQEMAAARHFIRTQGSNFSEEQRYEILQPQFEFNPSHPIMKKLSELKVSNPKLAKLVAEQVFANSMVSAGLVEDPRTVLSSLNELLEMALEKH